MKHVERTRKLRVAGLLLIIIPPLLLLCTLLGFAFLSMYLKSIDVSNTTAAPNLISQVISTLLFIFGIFAVLGIAIGIPLGIILIIKSRKLNTLTQYDNRSGKGDESEIPEEIDGWNWGAAGLTWIWGAYHEVWISFLSFVPIVGIFFWIVLGILGNEWAWRKTKWESVEHFKKSQRKWRPWGILFVILKLAPVALSIIALFF